MQTNVKPKAPDDRRDFVVIPSDQVRVAPSDAELTDLLRAAARQHSDAGAHAAPDPSVPVPVPAVDTTFRATAVNDDAPVRGQTFGRRLMRAVAALLLAMGIGAAALTWQTFGYAAKKVLLTWAPKWAIVASLPLKKLGLAPESKPSDDPADAPPAQAAAPAQTNTADSGAPANAAANASTPSTDSTQQLQSMGRDLANANQEIEALKASIAELKASQQQMSRDLAKAASDRVAEQAARAKAAAARKLAPPPYSPTTTAAAPAPAYRPSPSAYSASAQAAISQPSPQATAQPYVPSPPMQLQPQVNPGLPSTAPRPPMPVQ
jgi:hypothetical protein